MYFFSNEAIKPESLMYADKQFVLFLFNNTTLDLSIPMISTLQICLDVYKSTSNLHNISTAFVLGKMPLIISDKNFSLLVIKLLLIIIHSLILQRLCLFQSTHSHLSCENLDTQSNLKILMRDV